MKYWKKAAALSVLGMALVFSGCGNKTQVTTQPPIVKTMIAGETTKGEKMTFSGTVHGYFESPLAFQTGGRIMARYVDQGQRVSAGEPLMKVDSKDAEEAVASARAAVNASEARAELAHSTLSRYEKLYAQNAISALTMDQMENQAKLADADLNNSTAALSRAEHNLSFTLLTADRDGVIGSTMYEVGQVVAAGTPVVSIIDDSRKDAYISLTEKQYKAYSVGMPCTVTFWALPGVTVEGRVRDIAASPNTATGTYDAKVTLIDPPDSVVVGMTAEVRFGGDKEGTAVFKVPLTAMATQSDKPAVWIVRDRKVHLVEVTTGEYGEDSVEITGGLVKGDIVVSAGANKLTEGEEVRT
ncbi:efflux RND transporter periplasmic adaptor subunit [uncultured Dialister sp.]|uniref:efflux RND transporter periplasmic adaptor subunit n=1 Tax=uncultured Dialister sp. TaxID=278064 RepID=UPI0025ED4639|nr:efflux RND transporter periplasmic adaptor subunit [uncultured Dialister sp.]